MHADGDVVVLNIDDVFRNGKDRRPVVGGIAAKLAALDPRAGFYLTGCVVAASLPDIEYQRYIETLTGSMPQFFVPHGIDPMSRDMEHAMRDPRFAELVRGRTVTSFMGSPALREFVLAHGGNYVMGTDESVGWANDKLNFRSLVEGVPGACVPQGDIVTGVDNIVQAVHAHLCASRAVYVRHKNGGGGMGSMGFHPKGQTLDEIKQQLVGDQDEFWRGASALVEEYLPPMLDSPGIAGDTETSEYYPYRQRMRNNASVGRIVGKLEGLNLQQLQDVKDHLAKSLRDGGFKGWFDVDAGRLVDGRFVLWETNARWNGARYVYRMMQSLFGKDWVDQGLLALSVDDFRLRCSLSFAEVRSALHELGLLATAPGQLDHVVIGIPPNGKSVGITIPTTDIVMAYHILGLVNDALGDRALNVEDQPLF